MPVWLIIGLGAGLVSTALFASAATGTMLGLFVLFFLSPLPVAVAGLGWGWRAAATAAVSGAAMIAGVGLAAAGTGRAAVFYLVAIGAPTAQLSYLVLLNRHSGSANPQTNAAAIGVEWYPIGRAVLWAALWAGGLATLGLVTTATDVDSLRAYFKDMIEKVFARWPELLAGRSFGAEEIAALAEVLTALLAFSVAAMWMTVAILNLWLAGHIARKSDRLARPWPDLSALALPRSAPLLLAAATLATFVPGYPALIASGFVSALLIAFMLVGLAILHQVTRGLGARPFILAGAYALLIMLPFSGLLLAAIGLSEPISPLRRKPPSPPPFGVT